MSEKEPTRFTVIDWPALEEPLLERPAPRIEPTPVEPYLPSWCDGKRLFGEVAKRG